VNNFSFMVFVNGRGFQFGWLSFGWRDFSPYVGLLNYGKTHNIWLGRLRPIS